MAFLKGKGVDIGEDSRPKREIISTHVANAILTKGCCSTKFLIKMENPGVKASRVLSRTTEGLTEQTSQSAIEIWSAKNRPEIRVKIALKDG